jgi:hypothetical protein
MPREQYSPKEVAKKISSFILGFALEIGFILFVMLLVIGVTSLVAFLLSLVG